jgi:hypothetical protein
MANHSSPTAAYSPWQTTESPTALNAIYKEMCTVVVETVFMFGHLEVYFWAKFLYLVVLPTFALLDRGRLLH